MHKKQKRRAKRPTKTSAAAALAAAPEIKPPTSAQEWTPGSKLPVPDTPQELRATRGREGEASLANATLEELCQALTLDAVRALEQVINDPKSPKGSIVAAATALLDRGHGKPRERVEIIRKTGLGELSIADLEAIVARQVCQAGHMGTDDPPKNETCLDSETPGGSLSTNGDIPPSIEASLSTNGDKATG